MSIRLVAYATQESGTTISYVGLVRPLSILVGLSCFMGVHPSRLTAQPLFFSYMFSQTIRSARPSLLLQRDATFGTVTSIDAYPPRAHDLLSPTTGGGLSSERGKRTHSSSSLRKKKQKNILVVLIILFSTRTRSKHHTCTGTYHNTTTHANTISSSNDRVPFISIETTLRRQQTKEAP